jgi:hypothetical protein
MNKHGASEESLMMLFRLLLVAVITFFVIGISAVYYEFYIDIRGSEASIMARDVVNCLAPAGEFIAPTGHEQNFLEFCNIKNTGRFYVNVSVAGKKYESGDSGAAWVKDLFDSGKVSNNIKTYEPGHFDKSFDVLFNNNPEKMRVEVFVNRET